MFNWKIYLLPLNTMEFTIFMTMTLLIRKILNDYDFQNKTNNKLYKRQQ